MNGALVTNFDHEVELRHRPRPLRYYRALVWKDLHGATNTLNIFRGRKPVSRKRFRHRMRQFIRQAE